MELLNPEIEEYVQRHSEPETDLLYRIYRETNRDLPYPRMLSGHLQGRFLSMISRMLRPMRILEIGTYTGYSAICLSEGLQAGGTLVSIEKNPELEDRIRSYWSAANLDGICQLHLGEAIEIMELLDEPYDLIFLDADKENYPLYIEPIARLSKSGSWILADNVLWSGKVLSANDPETRGIRQFNEMIQSDTRFRNVLLPIRDGMMVAERV
jgi:caffeoyl-CoA O-methyltransferase